MDITATGDRLAIADGGNHRVRVVTPDRRISTIVGSGDPRFSGDGAPAAMSGLSAPTAIAFDPAGNLYVTDFVGSRIRRVATDCTIGTVAGTGKAGFSGDGGPATQATLSAPCGIASDAAGNLYIADYGNHRIRRISTIGTITTVAA